MQITRAEFKCSSEKISQVPKDDLRDVAFIGRSNVGKSSLINRICGNKKAKVEEPAEEEKKEEMVETPPTAEGTPEEPVSEETELEKEEIAEEVKEEKEEAPEVDWEAECTKLRQECDDLQKEVEALKALVAKYQPSATPAAQKPAKADWLTMVRELNSKHLPEQEYARAYVALKAEHKPEFDAFMKQHSKR